jgi:cytochrome c
MRRCRTALTGCVIALTTSLLLALVGRLGNTALDAAQPPVVHASTANPRITDADVVAFAQRTREASFVQSGVPAQLSGEGDAVRGRAIFEKRCTGCHALTRDREGPRLGGVYGRTAGDVAGFDYSPALKKARIVWNDASLEQWLTDPDTLVPGNNMEFHVAKPQERRDLIAFLKQASAK